MAGLGEGRQRENTHMSRKTGVGNKEKLSATKLFSLFRLVKNVIAIFPRPTKYQADRPHGDKSQYQPLISK